MATPDEKTRALYRTGSTGKQTTVLKLVFSLLLLCALPAQGEDCSQYPGGLLDGFAGTPAPSQIKIDRNCTLRNYPASNPLNTNFSFLTQPGQSDERWLVVFDNVVHTGQMACNSVAGHKIWFTNGSSTAIQEGCQNLLVPVEKIEKANPAGQTTATVGVPFTYRLTMPVLFDSGTGTVINGSGSLNDLHGVTIWDDLNATGADLAYVGHTAYWLDDGTPAPHTFSNVGGVLTFDNFPIIPAGQQIILELTVVLENTATNTIGTQFVNTAKWDFGRLIDGVFYEPLPGEWGITPPMTIGGPELTLTKTGPANLNLGEAGQFRIDIYNSGTTDAWNATILDRLPDETNGSMCDLVPTISSARVFAADGVTPIPGKGALIQGTDYTFSYNGASCELSLTMLTAAAAIGPDERLIIDYQTELDRDTRNGVSLTNVAAVVQWFNGDRSNTGRQVYTRTLTNGTVGTPDHEDAHTIITALTGTFFEKTVANLTNGTDPTAIAAPGETLRYSIWLRTTDTPLNDFRIFDDLGRLNGTTVFAPGTLTLVPGTIPSGADTSSTNPGGGTNGAGIVDIRNMNLSADSELEIQFDVELVPAIDDGTVVLNQAELFDTIKLADSDDPNVNGLANPDVAGDEDPTRVTIQSTPLLRVEKVSSYLAGDPDVLLAGETLRYTITVENTGTGNAENVVLVDQVPANTTYVSGSTTLNGNPVADAPGGESPLATGILINTPADPTPGLVVAGIADNAATITFDVVVFADAPDGTVLSNQAFVTAADHDIVQQPSDDPRTPLIDDPTRDVVGNFPLLFASKSAELHADAASPGLIDPGDVLRYTITIYNNGRAAATAVELTDLVPTDTTYVADSVTLNDLPVGQPDSGVFPLIEGIPVSSAELTPPLPGTGQGMVNPGETAVVQFDLQVNAGVAPGTLISNQAVVSSAEVPLLLTDGDGNPATGPEPTVVVTGDAQQLSILKEVSVVGGGAALPGAELEYVVTVNNIGRVPAYYIEITDDLAAASPGYLTYVDLSATMNGLTAGVSFAGTTITADYFSTYGPLDPDESVTLRFRAIIDPDLVAGTTVTNTGRVTWNDIPQWAEASVSIDVGARPDLAMLSGSVWHDANHDKIRDAVERALEGWSVELLRDDLPIRAILTDSDGNYALPGVMPNYGTGASYSLRFSAPGAGSTTALLGAADSGFVDGLQRIDEIFVDESSNTPDLNLPIDPNGVIYDSIARSPIAGAVVTLVDVRNGVAIPAGCFDDPNQQGQVTIANGYYKFDLNFSDLACPPSGLNYLIEVAPPDNNYVSGVSELIPPTSDQQGAPFDVPACPNTANDAVPATTRYCEAQPSEFPPTAALTTRSTSTTYHTFLKLDGSQKPGSAQLFNNHIPLDPRLDEAVSISKTTPMVNVSRGQLVPYVITLNNSFGAALHGVSIVDRFPAGFRYVEGSARFDDVEAEPVIVGGELIWSNISLLTDTPHKIKLLLAVGAGVAEGKFVNRAQALNSLTGGAMSGEAEATVRIIPDPTFDCTDVTGKVFDDSNRNGYQDGDEAGLAGVRVVSANGLAAATDSQGRYHITCAITPMAGRGSNFALKLDDRTLPSGFRTSTRPVQVQRATRGKALRMNFGASIHHVVGLDIADAVFEPDTVQMRPQWQPRIGLLLQELQKRPSVLRLSYVADVESEALVQQRMDTLKSQIAAAWDELDCCYELVIEPEVFWRLGGPPQKSEARNR